MRDDSSLIFNCPATRLHRKENKGQLDTRSKAEDAVRKCVCSVCVCEWPTADTINLLKPNDIYICRTAALTSRLYILNIYSTNIHTEYFKHA